MQEQAQEQEQERWYATSVVSTYQASTFTVRLPMTIVYAVGASGTW